jgi:hypothetical protein
MNLHELPECMKLLRSDIFDRVRFLIDFPLKCHRIHASRFHIFWIRIELRKVTRDFMTW